MNQRKKYQLERFGMMESREVETAVEITQEHPRLHRHRRVIRL